MAKKSAIEKNKQKELRVERRKSLRDQLRNLIKKGSDEERAEALHKMHGSKRNDSPVRVRRRCRCCGRPRGVFRKFGLCRICLREAIMKRGDVPGGRKASW